MISERSLVPMWVWLLWLGAGSLAGCGDSAGGSTVGTAGSSAGNAAAGSGAQTAGSASAQAGGMSLPAGGASAAGGTNAGSGKASSGSGGTSGAGAPASNAGSSNATGDISCRSQGDGKSTISFVNHCDATLSFRGSDIEGGELAPGEHACRDVGAATGEIPAIRFWGFIGMDPGGERYTLAELTLNTSFNDFDWYNISHVDASNLPMQIVPVDMPKCRVLTCADSLLANCPAVGQFKDANGMVVSCVSPDRNDPNSVVAQYFEASCKDAYSWSGDDSESVAACAGEDYDVVFCP